MPVWSELLFYFKWASLTITIFLFQVSVAIKLFHKANINNQEDFLKEARTMQQLQHECIVNFLGISESDNHELLLVSTVIIAILSRSHH